MINELPGERIGLKLIPSQSELFQFIPISVSEPVRIIPNQTKKRFVSSLMKNGQKTIRLNPIQSEASIQIITISDSLRLILLETSAWINPSSDWKLCSHWFVFIRINSPDRIGLSRIDFWPIFIERDRKNCSD